MTSLERDRRGKGRIDEMGGLNSIVSFLVVILETIVLLSREESLEKCPNLTFFLSDRMSLMALATVNSPRQVLNTICPAKRPDLERTRIVALIGVEMDFMVL